jgi:hypothetical protein
MKCRSGLARSGIFIGRRKCECTKSEVQEFAISSSFSFRLSTSNLYYSRL